MNLEIISPEKVIYKGEVDSITLPGMMGLFTILDNHAPIVSALKKGVLAYKVGNEDVKTEINSGFVEVGKNIVSICIE
ncbi:MAG: ATP synthase F1 subunit epsilon [Dysgonamonadaceae bacterium]|jgi:F-type H+-transporting ATPase subunit epsilon|nr:ATP synthase F1 subunit epsilon [Dysgonamonadaceae bacterium]